METDSIGEESPKPLGTELGPEASCESSKPFEGIPLRTELESEAPAESPKPLEEFPLRTGLEFEAPAESPKPLEEIPLHTELGPEAPAESPKPFPEFALHTELGPEALAESPLPLGDIAPPLGTGTRDTAAHVQDNVILSVPAKDLLGANGSHEIPHPCVQGIRDDTARIKPQSGLIARITNAYGGPHHLSTWVFLRVLGAVHMISAWSLWSQYEGLIGSRGLAPAAQWMERLAANHVAWWQVPTLAWWSASDAFLAGLCGAQLLGGLLLLTGLLAWPALVLAGICALSLMLVGGPFLSFQWDALLVETSFFTLFLQPITLWRPAAPSRQPYHRVGLLLLQVLTFKLMLSAGLVKLASGDKVWADASALSFHFFTQPLPTWTAWHVQQWPAGVLKALCLVLFFIELVCPFLLLLPRWFRAGGGASFVLLMAGIAATGNYTFFNLLTAALALTWIDDRVWRTTLSRWIPLEPVAPPEPSAAAPWMRVAPILAGFLFIPLHLWLTAAAAGWTRSAPPPAPWGPVFHAVRPFAVMNSYGLFAVMTTRRPEISVELSPDGHFWFPVEFRNKPGDTFKAPAFVAPHQPRLDWQMWFAALADGSPQPWQHNPWLINLLQALLEQRPEVQKLLAVLPKGIGTPRFARCMVTDYEFTSRAERAANGAWWKRVNPPRPFVPSVSLSPRVGP